MLVLMTIIGSFGGFFFKKSTENSKGIVFLLKNKFFYVGGILYFISSLMNIYLLKYVPYVIVLPLTSITYIWTLIISYNFLNEKIGKLKIVGVLLIIFGAVLIGGFNG